MLGNQGRYTADWQGCARDLFGRDETETETLQVAETLPRRLVKSSKQSPQVAAYRDNEVVSGLITSHL